MSTTSDGHAELNKKLCAIESLKCYIEHLSLFHKFGLLLPPPPPATMCSLADENLAESREHETTEAGSSRLPVRNNNANFLNEMSVNLKSINARWTRRRQDSQVAQIGEQTTYPFTYMIDCIIEECKMYANTSKFFVQANENAVYPPKSINDLLEICLECNLSTKMKQVVILYVLCDLMHTEQTPSVQNYVKKATFFLDLFY